MKTKQCLVLDYSDTIMDNFSTLAYAKIIQNLNNIEYFYENDTNKRNMIENYMSDFDIDLNFISSKKVSDIVGKTYFLNKIFLKNKRLFNKCVFHNILFKNKFDISDIHLITEDIKAMFRFKDLSFIKNFDILDDILSTNSIGIFISSKDEFNNQDAFYLKKSVKRLNKFVKNPKLFIFSDSNSINISTFINYQIVKISNWKEIYYFLSNCKHHVIFNKKNSYSMNFWGSVVLNKEYSYCVCKRNKYLKNKSAHNLLFID